MHMNNHAAESLFAAEKVHSEAGTKLQLQLCSIVVRQLIVKRDHGTAALLLELKETTRRRHYFSLELKETMRVQCSAESTLQWWSPRTICVVEAR